MKMYSWASGVRDNLISAIEKGSWNLLKISGCVLVLQYWLLGHTTLIEPLVDDDAPRFVNGILRLLKCLKQKRLSKLKRDKALHKPLKMTAKEKKMYGEYGLQVLGETNESSSSSKTDGDETKGEIKLGVSSGVLAGDEAEYGFR